MKKVLFYFLIANLFLTACSPQIFLQIGTLSADNVKLEDDGAFKYEDAIMCIEYNFWSENGKFQFTVTNNTDDAIYLNLAKSHFINNGYAYDYYQARTYIYEDKNSSFSELIIHGTSFSEKGVAIEYMEQPIACIPAHSSKVFEEFKVASSVFRECGFVRDPSKKETSVREYSDYSSPQIIENRLVFNINELEIPVTNMFYVSQYQNISYNDAIESVKTDRCDGSVKEAKFHKMSGNNKFYISYSTLAKDGTSANDRTTKSIFQMNFGKYNNGLYD